MADEEKDGRLLGLTVKEWAFFFTILLTFLTSLAGIVQNMTNSAAVVAKVEQQAVVAETRQAETVHTAKVAADAAVEAKTQAEDTKQQVQALTETVKTNHDETAAVLNRVTEKMSP